MRAAGMTVAAGRTAMTERISRTSRKGKGRCSSAAFSELSLYLQNRRLRELAAKFLRWIWRGSCVESAPGYLGADGGG